MTVLKSFDFSFVKSLHQAQSRFFHYTNHLLRMFFAGHTFRGCFSFFPSNQCQGRRRRRRRRRGVFDKCTTTTTCRVGIVVERAAGAARAVVAAVAAVAATIPTRQSFDIVWIRGNVLFQQFFTLTVF